MEQEGMTDKQFEAYLRLLINNIEDAKDEMINNNTSVKLDKLIETLKSTLNE